MLRIDFKRLFWNAMVGREAFGYTFMVVNQTKWSFVMRKIPAGKDKQISHMRGEWVRSTNAIVTSFRKQWTPE